MQPATGSRATLFYVLTILVCLGCGRKSADGESCSRTDDCESPLRCISLKCVPAVSDALPVEEGSVTPEANTPDPQMITVGSQLELKPSRDHQEMVFAQLTLSDEGLFRVQARGPGEYRDRPEKSDRNSGAHDSIPIRYGP